MNLKSSTLNYMVYRERRWFPIKNDIKIRMVSFLGQILIRLFRIISISSKTLYFRLPNHMILLECYALDFRCQCTQRKLQSISAVLRNWRWIPLFVFMFHFNDQRKLCLKEHFRNKPNALKFKELMTYKNEYDLKELCRFFAIINKCVCTSS